MRDQDEFRIESLDARRRQAIDDLEQTIVAGYPATTFEVVPSPEDSESLWLIAMTDVDDTDEVGDLVLDRVVSLIADEGIYVHVIPVRTPERIEVARTPERRVDCRHSSVAS
jgi:hypothetical protein